MPWCRLDVNPKPPLVSIRFPRYLKSMDLLAQFQTPLSKCGYLPDQQWQLQYEIVGRMEPAEYAQRMREGWRRFGHSLFRPACPNCRRCQSLRVDVSRFRPSRSQRRNVKLNEGEVYLQIGQPRVTPHRLKLYDRFHAHQSELRGWPLHSPKDAASYAESFTFNPYPIEEWCYYSEDRLVGVGYVDALTIGLSAIYFFYEPDERQRGLGVWNVLNLIVEARRRGLPHAYLGYHVSECQSLEYKADFRPNEVLDGGLWKPFRSAPTS